MGIMETISDIVNLSEVKKNTLRKAILTLLLEWKDLENHLELTQKCFQESYTELNSRQNHLHAIQESVTQSSNDPESTRKSIEKRFQEVQQKENEFNLFRENGIRELALQEEKLGMIRKEVKLREERMNEQEKLMERLFVEIKMERERFEGVRKMVDEGLMEMSVKQKCVEDCVRDHECSKGGEFAERVKEVELKEKKMEAMKKEIELREKDLSSMPKSKPTSCQMASNENVVHINNVSETSAGDKCSRNKRLTSKVWQHFTKLVKEDGTSDQCKCNYCGKLFACKTRSGTSGRLRHISKGRCPVYRKSNTGLQTDYARGQACFQQSIGVQDEELPERRGDVGQDANISLTNALGGHIMEPEHETLLQQPVLQTQPRAESWRGTCVVQNATQSGFTTQLCDLKLHQKDQSYPSVDQQLFWTSCPFCHIKYQYSRNLVCQTLRCKRCSRPFTACDIDTQGVSQKSKASQTATSLQMDISIEGTIELGTHNSSQLLTHNSGSQGSSDGRIEVRNTDRTGQETQVMHAEEKYDGDENASGDTRERFQMSLCEAEKQRYSGDLRCKSRKRERKHVGESIGCSNTSNLSDIEYFLGCSRRASGDKAHRESDKKYKVVLYNDDPIFGFITCFPAAPDSV